MTITATKTYSPTPAITSFECFTFDDGATIRVSGGLICSKHGRRHCAHHKLAHEAIVTTAAQKREMALPASATAPERTETLVASTPAYLWKAERHIDSW